MQFYGWSESGPKYILLLSISLNYGRSNMKNTTFKPLVTEKLQEIKTLIEERRQDELCADLSDASGMPKVITRRCVNDLREKG